MESKQQPEAKTIARHDFDFYATPAPAVHALLDEIGRILPPHMVALEPGCGDGAIIRACDGWMDRYGHTLISDWSGVEIQEELCERAAAATQRPLSLWTTDFLTWEAPTYYHIAIGNPPFNLAREFVAKCLRISKIVCLYLPLGFIGSQGRADFHRENPSDLLILPERFSHTGDGKTDQRDNAWFCFGLPGSSGGNWRMLTTPKTQVAAVQQRLPL